MIVIHCEVCFKYKVQYSCKTNSLYRIYYDFCNYRASLFLKRKVKYKLDTTQILK
jgi:hypothetical protein